MYNVSANFLTKIKESSRRLKSNVTIGKRSVTNLIPHPTTGWGVEFSSLTSTNGTLITTGLGTGAYVGCSRTTSTTATVGDKIYMRGIVRVTNSVAQYIALRIHDGTGSTLTISLQNTPVSNNWYTISGVTPVDNTGTLSGIIRTNYADATTANGKTHESKDVIILNLTSIYGVGNEPTLAQMDAIIDKIGWFTGTNSEFPQTDLDGNVVVDWSLESSFGSDGLPTIGSVVSNKLNLTVLNDVSVPTVLVGVPIVPYIALDVTGTGSYEWVKIGEFYADTSGITKGKQTTSIQAFDKMADYGSMTYSSDLTYPERLENIIVEMNTKFGVEFEPRTLYGRNLCVTQFQDWESGNYDATTGAKEANANRVCLGGGFVAVTPNTSYYFDTFDTDPTYTLKFSIRAYNSSGVFVRSIGGVTSGTSVTMGATEAFISVTLYETGETVTYSFWQNAFATGTVRPFICLTSEVDKTFEEFLPHIRFETLPVGTVRQVIGNIASIMTTNATINYDGQVDFRFKNTTTFTLDANNYIDFKLLSESQILISQLQVKKGEELIVAGDTSGFAMMFDNPQITNSDRLTLTHEREYPMQYYAFNMMSQGMPHLELGDTVSFTDVESVVRELLIINHKLIFNGGLISEFIVNAPQQEVIQNNVTGGSTLGDAINKSQEVLMGAISEASSIITGNKGGNVITIMDANGKPTELVICDTNDINTAVNVWRWNMGGLGFSSTGYTGTYETAITRDGHIVADFIDTGSLTADIIKAGILQSVNGNSWINMANGTFSFGDGRLAFDGTTFTINYNGTSLEGAINAKADASELTGMKTYFEFGDTGMTIGKKDAPQQISIDNVSMQFLDYANITELTITSINGNGTVVTANFASQSVIPFGIGSYVEVNVSPTSVYNGMYQVTACTLTSVSWSDSTIGAESGGTVKPKFVAHEKAVAWITGERMYIKALEATNELIVGNHKLEKLTSSNITLIKFIG